MAYIRKRNNKFKIIIKKQGYPRVSKTFLEKKTAQLWDVIRLMKILRKK